MSDTPISEFVTGDFTEEQLNPQPPCWPKCPTCDTSWVLRRCLSLSSGWSWMWQRDCKHKATPVIHDPRQEA